MTVLAIVPLLRWSGGGPGPPAFPAFPASAIASCRPFSPPGEI